MGQSQSTTSQEDTEFSGSSSREHKVDFYELLAIPHNAPLDEIRKAYKKKALELHPDKNYGNVEAATKLFAEIQSAYQVLSDPQERSWYDTHRDAFLSPNGAHGKSEYARDSQMITSDDILKLFSQFSPDMDFSDAPCGFYGGLQEVFSKISLEERTACRSQNMDVVDYPSFGNQQDSFEDVVRPFYAVWSSFATKKSFAWRDVYRYSEAPDRRVRRLMEKENRRLRDESIRQFNEAVRSLVAFVKKRDPRYRAGIRSESQRQESLRQTAVAQAAKSRAANEAKLREHITPDWAKSEEIDDEDSDFSESEPEHFECIVCRKDFKSLNQFNAHERSKKHNRAVKQLRWEMRAESDRLNLDQNEAQQGEVQSMLEDGAARNFSSINRRTSEDKSFSGISGGFYPTAASNTQSPRNGDCSKHMGEDDFPVTRDDDTDQDLDKTFNESINLEANPAEEAIENTNSPFQQRPSDASETSPVAPPKNIGKAKKKRAWK
ncbi:putative C2H2 finger domain protein [Aspergillus clavatus NRRL 1]|uniref:C2H2 finger domain protein, putative n=1 Tax=Aspergillus clavatus (strain ATCC 1007 / CBS 513.65 / DSM 816 / NCTC 3887 / NRRL 1 / QM 1276 / 107) TaxID=344612 RepID=A1CJ06_ASPCL|nr:C2H2 finger domain protein, putative [Aspergillus clavatus NRRL 1]EAW09130.1 C2H2 finger domain protein, putative [Aspergillus clavatus NRRL 1]